MPEPSSAFDSRIAAHLRELRAERGWSLDELAERCGISRATLSRLERAAVSPTATVLGKLCAAFNMPVSRLLLAVENTYAPLVRRQAQSEWHDPAGGFVRRSVSPPSPTLGGEAIVCDLQPGKQIDYDAPPRNGLEHHLVMLAGRLEVRLGEQFHDLETGDCLRYRLTTSSSFRAGADNGARYILFMT